jgi:cytochrome c-L
MKLFQLIIAVTLVPAALAAPVVFPDSFDGKPLATPLKPGEQETEALKRFKESGVNVYRDQKKALTDGKALYEQWCQVCHDANAKGKMGPSLLGPAYAYPQTANDVGMFAVIYGGASGAMQPFSQREITQDEILKVIAYVRSLPR